MLKYQELHNLDPSSRLDVILLENDDVQEQSEKLFEALRNDIFTIKFQQIAIEEYKKSKRYARNKVRYQILRRNWWIFLIILDFQRNDDYDNNNDYYDNNCDYDYYDNNYDYDYYDDNYDYHDDYHFGNYYDNNHTYCTVIRLYCNVYGIYRTDNIDRKSYKWY